MMFLAFVVAISASSGAQSLTVQVVDVFWVPIPGAEIRVVPVASCADPRPAGEASEVAASRSGEAQFVVKSGSLLISASLEGFEARDECIELGEGNGPQVQLRLRPDPALTVSTHPVTRPRSRTADPKTWPLISFAGVYREASGAFYAIAISEKPDALTLSLPGAETMHFREREGLTFRSHRGVLEFQTDQGRVSGFTFRRSDVRAAVVNFPRVAALRQREADEETGR